MVSLEDIRNYLKTLPDTHEGISWDSISFKSNNKLILFWNSKYDCPVFKVSFDERDFLLEFDSETFFTTDHHKKWPCILGRPEKLDFEWVKSNLYNVWRKVAKKTIIKQYENGGN